MTARARRAQRPSPVSADGDRPDGQRVDPRTEHGQHRGQQGQGGADGTADHDGAGDPDRAQDHELEQDQAKQAEQHRQTR